MEDTPDLDPYLAECLNINPENIQEEFIAIPGLIAYWNARYADAQRAHLKAKHKLDVREAQLMGICRQEIINAGGKPTEAMVAAAVQTNEEFIRARAAANEAEAAKSEAYGNLDAVRTKKEMLISLGAHLRVELENDPSLRSRVRGRRDLANEG